MLGKKEERKNKIKKKEGKQTKENQKSLPNVIRQ